VVLGLSLATAVMRAGADIEYRALSVESPFAALGERLGVPVRTVPFEDEVALGPDAFRDSALFRAITEYAPDVLVVDLFWFTVASFIRSLPCRKVLLVRQVDPAFWRLRLRGGELAFTPGDWDLVLRIEPGFETPFPSDPVDPILIRDRDEIMDAAAARAGLGLPASGPTCLFAFNGKEGEGAAAWKSFSYLRDEGWTVLRSDNRAGGLFPAIDWYGAFDLLVCGAGYSAFWEARYLEKEAFFVPYARRFESQAMRIARCSDHVPAANGANRVLELIQGL